MILSAQLQHARVQQHRQPQQYMAQQRSSQEPLLPHSQEQLQRPEEIPTASLGGIVEVHPEPTQSRNEQEHS